MRTMWKQFTVNWLTSGRVAFTTQRAKARRSQQLLWPVKFLGYEAIFNLPFRPKGFYSCRSGMGQDNLLINSKKKLINKRYRILMDLVSNRFCKQTVKKQGRLQLQKLNPCFLVYSYTKRPVMGREIHSFELTKQATFSMRHPWKQLSKRTALKTKIELFLYHNSYSQ